MNKEAIRERTLRVFVNGKKVIEYTSNSPLEVEYQRVADAWAHGAKTRVRIQVVDQKPTRWTILPVGVN